MHSLKWQCGLKFWLWPNKAEVKRNFAKVIHIKNVSSSIYIYIWHFILFWDRAVKINAKIVLKNFPDKSSFWQRRWTFFDLIFFLYYLRTSFFPLNLSLPLTVESWELFLLWLESLFTVLHFLRQLRFLQHMPVKSAVGTKRR